MKNYKRPESVIIVVCTQQGEFLLLQRADVPDFWQSITGSLESEESARQAAIRELQEETGLDANSGELVDLDTRTWFTIWPQFKPNYAPDAVYNLEHAFGFILPEKPAEIRLSPREHLSYKWLTRVAAVDLAASSSNRWLIQTL